jgi:hypothetical protein
MTPEEKEQQRKEAEEHIKDAISLVYNLEFAQESSHLAIAHALIAIAKKL